MSGPQQSGGPAAPSPACAPGTCSGPSPAVAGGESAREANRFSEFFWFALSSPLDDLFLSFLREKCALPMTNHGPCGDVISCHLHSRTQAHAEMRI